MALNLDKVILGGGLLAIGATVFAESGLLIGFFLPGDTLLFGAGILAAQGSIPLISLIVVVIVSAVLGDNVGYSIGRRTGHRIFKKKDGILFRHEHIQKAEKFYERHGGKTIILARFIPIVRTFAPIVAGVGKMPREKFLVYNFVGAAVWGGGITLLGYWFGSKIPGIENYVLPTFILVTILTFGSAFAHILKEKRVRTLLWSKIRLILRNIFLNKRVD